MFRTTRILAATLVAAAAIPSAAVAQDRVSPDVRDSASPPAAGTPHDLRAPDSSDGFSAVIDRRSADAADPYSGVPVQVIAPEPVVSVRRVDTGFDVADAGIGAAVLLSALLLVLGGAGQLRRGRLALR